MSLWNNRRNTGLLKRNSFFFQFLWYIKVNFPSNLVFILLNAPALRRTLWVCIQSSFSQPLIRLAIRLSNLIQDPWIKDSISSGRAFIERFTNSLSLIICPWILEARIYSTLAWENRTCRCFESSKYQEFFSSIFFCWWKIQRVLSAKANQIR